MSAIAPFKVGDTVRLKGQPLSPTMTILASIGETPPTVRCGWFTQDIPSGLTATQATDAGHVSLLTETLPIEALVKAES